MTASKSLDREPTEIEALLPFHAAGTLGMRDSRRVDQALANDPDLARQYAAIQDEYAETILLNESLGVPSSRAMQKLFAAIDAEPAPAASSLNPFLKITAFVSYLSPRTLAYTGMAALVALLVQAGIIGAVLVRNQGAFQTAAYQGHSTAGAYSLVRFAPGATMADIAKLLETYEGTIVSGPNAGMFRIKFGSKALSKQEAAQLLGRLQAETAISLAVAAD